MFHQNRQGLLFKTVVVGVHYIQWHLDTVESELVRERGLEHLVMDIRTLVPRKPDIAHLACFFRRYDRFHSPAGAKDSLRVIISDNLMKLEQVDMISLQALK